MKKKLLFFTLVLLISVLFAANVHAEQDYSDYSKVADFDNGKIRIISFSPQWNNKSKLQQVYDELLKNFHGSEINLLSEIYLYPDRPIQAEGEYKFKYLEDGKDQLTLDPGSHINLFNCDAENTIDKLARTLSHEYGHHFTYYYLIKYENKVFDDAGTLYQEVRGLKGNPNVNSGSHEWSMAEIAAEDYAQYFGSPTGKNSITFYDVASADSSDKFTKKVDTGVYNYSPQENKEIQTAANVPEARQYWLTAMGYKGTALDTPPSAPYLYFDSVNTIDTSAYDMEETVYNYAIKWTPAADDTSHSLEYTVVAYPDSLTNMGYPVKTVKDGGELTAFVGSYQHGDSLYSDGILRGANESLYFIVYAKDENGNITASNVLHLDLSDSLDPKASNFRAASKDAEVRVLYNGDFISFEDLSPQIVNGRIMVPLRKIFETLGAEVEWNAETSTVTAVKDDVQIQLKTDSTIAYKNGRVIRLDVGPRITNGRTLVPLRFISESLGSSVQWDSVSKVAVIE